MQKGQTHTVEYAVGAQYTVGMQYAVGVSAKKVNPHSGISKYGWWGLLPLVQKGQTHTVGNAVGAQYAVGVSAEWLTHTVGYAVCSRYTVCSRYAVCSRC